jgi:hypothetical protein
VALEPSALDHEAISGIDLVRVGSLAKLFTPEAKKRYATMGNINRMNKTIFFFMMC